MKIERPIAATELTTGRDVSDSAIGLTSATCQTAQTSSSSEQHRQHRAEPHRARPVQRMAAIPLRGVLARHVQQHHDEQEEHHDRAGVDDDLHDRDERRVEQHVEAGQRAERRDQQQHAVDRVALRDDEQRGADRERAEQ